jgi:hypothetical protein
VECFESIQMRGKLKLSSFLMKGSVSSADSDMIFFLWPCTYCFRMNCSSNFLRFNVEGLKVAQKSYRGVGIFLLFVMEFIFIISRTILLLNSQQYFRAFYRRTSLLMHIIIFSHSCTTPSPHSESHDKLVCRNAQGNTPIHVTCNTVTCNTGSDKDVACRGKGATSRDNVEVTLQDRSFRQMVGCGKPRRSRKMTSNAFLYLSHGSPLYTTESAHID